jgi:hypothetical protein
MVAFYLVCQYESRLIFFLHYPLNTFNEKRERLGLNTSKYKIREIYSETHTIYYFVLL